MQLGMTPKSVQVWFQNRRQKLRAMQPQPESTRTVSSVLLGGSQVHLNHHLLGATADPAGYKDTFADSPATSGARLPSAEAARSPAGVDAPLSISPTLSPALVASLTALAGKGGVLSTDGLRSRAPLGSIPRHLVAELARLTSAEDELVLLASHLSERKAQLVTSIAQHAATARMKLGEYPHDAAPMDDDYNPPACILPPPHPSPPPGSCSPPYSTHSPSPEEPYHPTHGRLYIDSPKGDASSPPSPAYQPDPAVQAGAACASAAGLSGLHLLSSMATHITAAAAVASAA
jgi:hypothetical protein